MTNIALIVLGILTNTNAPVFVGMEATRDTNIINRVAAAVVLRHVRIGYMDGTNEVTLAETPIPIGTNLVRTAVRLMPIELLSNTNTISTNVTTKTP